jgi:hypothetical protein
MWSIGMERARVLDDETDITFDVYTIIWLQNQGMA